MPNVGPIEGLAILVVSLGFLGWPAWRICAKAGFHGALGLLVLVPFFNLLLLYYLAFAEWPATRRYKPYSGVE